MSYETLETSREDGVLTVTLNRPERLNALTVQMLEELLRALDEIDADDDVRAVIVTGAGRALLRRRRSRRRRRHLRHQPRRGAASTATAAAASRCASSSARSR